MSRTAATELEIPGIVSGEHRPTIVVSYGLGLDSTALLLRWLTEPDTRDFDLADMAAVTAMTGDEFASTASDVDAGNTRYHNVRNRRGLRSRVNAQ